MTHLYLIRHGEGMFAVHQHLADWRGAAGLSPYGVRQAERLRDRLVAGGEIRADHLISSSLPRARQTADILAPALNLPVQPDDALQEMRYGAADGMAWTDYVAQYGAPDVARHPFRPIGPGGENWGQFMLRVGTALHRLVEEHPNQTLALVCHGGVIDRAFLYCLGLNTLTWPSFDFATQNTSITHWELQKEGDTARWRLHRYNDASHLTGLSRPT